MTAKPKKSDCASTAPQGRHGMLIRNASATRWKCLKGAARELRCFVLGHRAYAFDLEIGVNCARCGQTLAYGPEITRHWDGDMKAKMAGLRQWEIPPYLEGGNNHEG